jgi:enoyl-[acyl-carrier protein] reductase III
MAGALSGKRVFVTGGSGAIGRAMCVRFAKLGADVAYSYFSNHEAADETTKVVTEAAGGRAPRVLRGNVGDAADCARLSEELFSSWPSVEIFVSNAASGVLKPTVELKAKHWDWTVGINARAFLLLANAIAPKMPSGGRILALTSFGAVKAIPMYAAIGASKAALESIVRNLAVELGPKGITVNAISPGIVETGALEFFPNREDLLKIAKLRTSVGRLCTPDDVADVAEFLVSPGAAMIHGQTINVDGGYSILA